MSRVCVPFWDVTESSNREAWSLRWVVYNGRVFEYTLQHWRNYFHNSNFLESILWDYNIHNNAFLKFFSRGRSRPAGSTPSVQFPRNHPHLHVIQAAQVYYPQVGVSLCRSCSTEEVESFLCSLYAFGSVRPKVSSVCTSSLLRLSFQVWMFFFSREKCSAMLASPFTSWFSWSVSHATF